MMTTKELYEAIHAWLSIQNPTDDQVREGAELLRQVLPARVGLYNTILRKPSSSHSLLTKLLTRHATHLAENMTVSEVAVMDMEVRQTVSAGISQLQEDPPALPASGEPSRSRGLRPDHDQLPDNIKALWPKNAERWKKMKSLYQTCLTLTQPCDRFELLKELKDNWYGYKKDMKKYDDYRPKEKE